MKEQLEPEPEKPKPVEKFESGLSGIKDPLASTKFPKEPVIDQTLQNLINEAQKQNANLAHHIEAGKLNRIEMVLKTSGLDSMSVIKTMNQIREILSSEPESA